MAKNKEIKNIDLSADRQDELLKEALIPEGEQPYELPKNWVWVKLGSIIYVSSGKNLTKNKMNLNGKIPVYGGNGITGFHDKYNVDENIILVGRVGYYCGSVHLTNHKSWVTDNAFIVKFDEEKIDKMFLYHLLIVMELGKTSNSSAQPVISGKTIYPLVTILPPIQEQKRIVEKLEDMLSKTKQAKELIAEAKETFELRRASMLHKAFTGELTKQWRIENKELTIGGAEKLLEQINEEKIKKWEEECEIAEKEGKRKPKKPEIKSIEEMKVDESEQPYELPDGWVWVRLGDVGENFQYGYTDKTKDSGNAKFLRITDIQDNKVEWDTVPYCDIDENKKEQYLLKENDLVVARTGATTGKSFLLKNVENSVFASYLIRVRIILISPEFTWYFMQNPDYWNQITEVSSGIAQPGVNATKLADLKFPLPPLKEQLEIVKYIEHITKVEEEAKDLLEMEEQIDLLEKSILSKAFRGELGTNNPDDEPAIELLKRLLQDKK